MKKIISLLLVVAMVFSLGTTVVFAQEDEPLSAGVQVPSEHKSIPADAAEFTDDGITYTVIRTAEALAAEKAVGNYILANDIDCGGKVYTSVPFVFANGSLLDGNGYTVSNLSVSNAEGAFRFGKASTVRNLTVGTPEAHVSITSLTDSWTGTFDAADNAVFENVKAYSDVTATGNTAGTSTAGGMVGWVNGAHQYINCLHEGNVTGAKDTGGWIGFTNSGSSVTMTGCINNGTVRGNTGNNAGGFIGCSANDLEMTDCVNNASVQSAGRVGGFVGYPSDSAASVQKFDHCVNNGSVSSPVQVGGFIGQDRRCTVFANCVNNGTVNGMATTADGNQNVGGFTGRVDKKQTYTNCSNNGTVNGTNRTGGFIGWAALASADLNHCTNRGNIGNTSLAENIGGLIGTNENVANIVDCYNYGTVMGSKFAGGFVGRISWNNTGKANISRSFNYGSVRGGAIIGGFIGYQSTASLGAVVTDCINYGKITAIGNAGGFMGEGNATEFTGCLNLGAVSNTAWGSISGFVGWADNITIDSCVNLGQISSTSTTGDGARIANFVGGGNCAAIKNCYAFGNVKALAKCGGILVGAQGTGDVFSITTAEGNKYFAVTNAVSAVGTDESGLTSQEDALALLNARFADYSFMVNQKEQIVIANPVLKAIQETEADGNNLQKVRFIATVEASNYEMLGFQVKTQVEGAQPEERPDQYCRYLFNSIKATENGKTVAYSAEKLFGSYIYALSINQVPTNKGTVTFEITPFAVGADGTKYTGVAYEVVYCNGEFVSAAPIISDTPDQA